VVNEYLNKCLKKENCEAEIYKIKNKIETCEENNHIFNGFLFLVCFVSFLSFLYLISPLVSPFFLQYTPNYTDDPFLFALPRGGFLNEVFNAGYFEIQTILVRLYYFTIFTFFNLFLFITFFHFKKTYSLYFFAITFFGLFILPSSYFIFLSVILFLLFIFSIIILASGVGGLLMIDLFRLLRYNDKDFFVLHVLGTSNFNKNKREKEYTKKLNLIQIEKEETQNFIIQEKEKILNNEKELKKVLDLKSSKDEKDPSFKHINNLILEFEKGIKDKNQNEYYKELLDLRFKNVIIEND
jgi:hypothetical protein